MEKINKNIMVSVDTIKKCKYCSITGKFEPPAQILQKENILDDKFLEKHRLILFNQKVKELFKKRNLNLDERNYSEYDE